MIALDLPKPGERVLVRSADGREVVGHLRADEHGAPILQPQSSGDVIARFECEDGRRTFVLYAANDPRVQYFALAEAEAQASGEEAPPTQPPLPASPDRDLDAVAVAALAAARARAEAKQAAQRASEPEKRAEEAPSDRIAEIVKRAQETAVKCYGENWLDTYEPPSYIWWEENGMGHIWEAMEAKKEAKREAEREAERKQAEGVSAPPAEPASEQPPAERPRDFRPKTLAEYDVGQSRLIRNLRVEIAATLNSGGVLAHVLLGGPPGLGKTTLAYVIANELGVAVHPTSGPALVDPTALLGLLSALRRGDILFIDEVHRMPTHVAEYMYQALEDFRIDAVSGTGKDARTSVQTLQRFCCIAATTNPGAMPQPLRDRFGLQLYLTFYKPEQLMRIATRTAEILGCRLNLDAAHELAVRSRGTARIVNRLVERCASWAQVMGDGIVTKALADEALASMGIDEAGLSPLDRRYMRCLLDFYGGGPAGLNAIAASLGDEEGNVQEVIEPYLLMQGFVTRTARGRLLTDRGRQHIRRMAEVGFDD